MDRDDQQRLRGVLEATLEDETLSRGEARELVDLAEGLSADLESLAFLRNEAFRLAETRIEGSPKAVLRWLDRVDKITDRAGRGPGPETVFEHVAFAPGDACLALIRTCLGAAREAIDVCVFTITDDRITKALLQAKARGVQVRVITDDEKAGDRGSDVDRIREAGVPVRTDHSPDHMHHKFCVVDGKLLLTGSYNWTRGATDNHENLYATGSPEAAQAYQREFDDLWGKMRP